MGQNHQARIKLGKIIMRIYKKLTAIFAAAILATGCASVETESWQNCAIAGALLGGAAGAFVEGATEVGVGAVAGGIIGSAICAETALDKAGVEPDTDGDGVADYKDQCPDSAPGAVVNQWGCAKALVLGGVHFHTASAELTDSAKKILLPIAVAHHKDHAGVSLVISGHTDSVGSDAFNQGLSERRAASVRAFMIRHGCDGNKLSTKGYGESKPVADNSTSEGRAKNRRVVLSVK
jgi:OOP family OmpA-OmpF porin